MHHFKSDKIDNMEHMCISGTEPLSVILSQTKWKSHDPKVPKTSWSQTGRCNKPGKLQFQSIFNTEIFLEYYEIVVRGDGNCAYLLRTREQSWDKRSSLVLHTYDTCLFSQKLNEILELTIYSDVLFLHRSDHLVTFYRTLRGSLERMYRQGTLTPSGLISRRDFALWILIDTSM